MANTHVFTKREEIANALIHGVGAVLAAAGLAVLVVLAALGGTVWHVTGFAIYGVTMLLLYTASTLVHSFPEGKAKDVFETLDHSSIYLFIAGTYTAILLTAMRGPLGWTLFGIIWGLAVAGIVFKAFFTKKFLYMSTLLYIAMGWLIVLAWKPLQAAMAPGGVRLMVAGGLAYTIGAVFYVWRGFRYHHAVWHLLVVAGSIFHYFAILIYLLP